MARENMPIAAAQTRPNAGPLRSAPLTLSLSQFSRAVRRGSKRRAELLAQRPAAAPPPITIAALLPVVDQQDILPHHRLLADRILRLLPSRCRETLKSFYVNYDATAQRGLGGASTMIVEGKTGDAEFTALIGHECGHVVDLGAFVGTAAAGTTAFFDGNEPIFADDPSIQFYQLSWQSATKRRTDSQDNDFVSGYAMTDPFEDFAETFAAFAFQPEEFARQARSNPVLALKYQWMATHVFLGTSPVAQGRYHQTGTDRPWDITKLPYQLL